MLDGRVAAAYAEDDGPLFGGWWVSTTAVIAALIKHDAVRVRLEAAIRGEGSVHHPDGILWCDTARALLNAVADQGASVAIIEWDDGPDGATDVEAAVRELRSEYPTVPVLAYVRLTAPSVRALLSAGRAGVFEAIIEGHDDVRGGLGTVLCRAARDCVADRARERLLPVAPLPIVPILTYALRHAHAAPTVADAARALMVHRKTLAAWCQDSGAPPPSVLISWCRLIAAVSRLADPGRSAERVAIEFGFASGSALGNMAKRHTGLSLAHVREQGPAVVLEIFARRLEGCRGPRAPLRSRHRAPPVRGMGARHSSDGAPTGTLSNPTRGMVP
jgi:AraC-like DNA-binding protein